ncbi:hypothetical protein MNB_SUP05-5-567 [hydrothermal vent metagenome]|uniref:Uncharacterized protein n=1 Tax=hydrothermal vent metagenome TaxID=652676 RepID=A0A1W1CIS8_9ZZZZ
MSDIEKLEKQIEILINRYENSKLENVSLYKQNQLLRQSFNEKLDKLDKVENRIQKLLKTL